MAIYRTINLSFWTDPKVIDDFTPEDRYFYLYLFTNPHTNLCGCYEISFKHIVTELGYSRDTVENLIKRFEDVHNVIQYCSSTKEILLLNWHKYNWTKSEKFRKPLLTEITSVKCKKFREYLMNAFNGYGIDTNCIDTTVTDTVTDSLSDNVNNKDSNTKTREQLGMDVVNASWGFYPRKKNKGGITKKSKEEISKIGPDHMIRAVKRYAKEVNGKDEQYILLGSTFFNGRYKDYLDENYETQDNDDSQMPTGIMTYRQMAESGERQ